MSRKVDPNSTSLSEEDKRYLAQRAQLPTTVLSVEEQRQLLDPEQNALSLENRANTGDVNTANISTEDLERELEARRKAQDAVVPKELFGSTSGAAPDEDEDEDDDALEPPYDAEGVTKAMLLTEINRRNQGRDDEDKISVVGTKPELAAALAEDDDEDED